MSPERRSRSPELLPQKIYNRLPRLDDRTKRSWSNRALVKFYILDDHYWSFYACGVESDGAMFGIEASPEGFAFMSFFLSEFENVNAHLDLEIKRDLRFQPTTLREIVRLHTRKPKR